MSISKQNFINWTNGNKDVDSRNSTIVKKIYIRVDMINWIICKCLSIDDYVIALIILA